MTALVSKQPVALPFSPVLTGFIRSQPFCCSSDLTVIRPAGIEDVVCVRGEADIQNTPANVTRLHGSPQVEASSGGVIQPDVLVFGRQRRKISGSQKTVRSVNTQRSGFP